VISSPPIKNPCFYGIDTSTKEELIASDKSVEQIRELIGADSLTFISVEGMMKALGQEGTNGYCLGCFTGNYPTEIYPDTLQYYYQK
jgi:amidophosphoribosyltransferase